MVMVWLTRAGSWLDGAAGAGAAGADAPGAGAPGAGAAGAGATAGAAPPGAAGASSGELPHASPNIIRAAMPTNRYDKVFEFFRV